MNVNQVFQGAVDSIAQIEGLWLIDYANAMTIESDDEFGELNDVTIGDNYLEITNEDTITLTKDDQVEIGQGLYFKVADDSNALRFYAMKEYTEPGTYEIRGKVATGTANWDATSFAGFFYDLNDNVQTETLNVTKIDERDIAKNSLVYRSTIEKVDYEFDKFGQYPVMGLFAEKYIPIKGNSPDKLAKLILDSDDKYTVRTGEQLDLGEGYALEAKQVDVDGEKVWLEFTKDGEFIDDEIISVTNGSNVWTVDLDDIQGEDDVVVLKVNVNQVFQGAVDSIAQIEGLWLIDYANAMTIDTDDEFGDLDDVTVGDNYLEITNEDSISLTRNDDIEIGEGMFFKVADDSQLRYYPYVEVTLGNETVSQPDEEETEGNVTDVEETPVEDVTPTEGEAVTPIEGATEPAAETTTTEAEGSTPGFGVVLGLVGLLAVVYLVRRNN